MKHPKLILLDYSGTLCLDCVRFGAPERLAAALVSSGLAASGLGEVDFFWEQVVNPTWIEGSTTGVGYAVLMERRLRELLDVPEEELRQAVRRFIDSYFATFRIDGRWEKTLLRLRDRPDISVIIVTDHYAEATKVIMNSLAGLDIRSGPIGDAQTEPGAFMVANSADLGFPKADRRFWEEVLHHVSRCPGGQVILVDDFGCNEAGGSDYADWSRVLARRDETTALVSKVFQTTPVVLSFFSSGDESPGATVSLVDLVRELAVRVGLEA